MNKHVEDFHQLAESKPTPMRIVQFHNWQSIRGVLRAVTPEGDKLQLANFGETSILLPNEPLQTKGGHVHLRDWVGQYIVLGMTDEVLSTGLLPPETEDKLQETVWELQSVLAGMLLDDAISFEDESATRAHSALGLDVHCAANQLEAMRDRPAQVKAAKERARRAVF